MTSGDYAARRPAAPEDGSPPPPATPADDLARQAARTPSATALSWDGGHWTYRQLDARAAALADRFQAAGALPGNPVTLCTTPGPDTVAALFALWRAGCLAVPLHEKLTPAEVAHARQAVMSTLHIDNDTLQLLTRPGGHGAILPAPDAPGGDQIRAGSGAPPSASDRPGPGAPPSPLAPPGSARPSPYAAFPDVIALLLTSGSTGAATAYGFTRAALAASASAVANRLDLTPDDRWALSLSLGHVGGLSLVVRAIMTGSSVRLWPAFDGGALARAVAEEQVTHLAVVPVVLRRLLALLDGQRIPPSLRCVLVGGAAAARPLLDAAWAAGLPVATTWGMTETASQVATAPPELARRHPGTAGPPLRGVEVRTPPGGVLRVRGPTLASIAVKGPGASPQALPRDPGGWFTTRDLGRVDTDGLVWIEGRADAIIVSGGLNVSPGEVERVIEGLFGVREAVVFGLPDEEWGEVVAAVVEGDPAAVSSGDIDRHCRARLVRGRCPSRIVVVDSLPRTWTGKVMRAAVGERFGPALGAPPLGPDSSKNARKTT